MKKVGEISGAHLVSRPATSHLNRHTHWKDCHPPMSWLITRTTAPPDRTSTSTHRATLLVLDSELENLITATAAATATAITTKHAIMTYHKNPVPPLPSDS